jgi:AraC-like DNA-binding protein
MLVSRSNFSSCVELERHHFSKHRIRSRSAGRHLALQRHAAAAEHGERMQPAESKAVPFRFSTGSILPRDRVAVLREVTGRVRLRLEIEPLRNGPCRAPAEHHSWAAASLYFCETAPGAHLALIQDGEDDFPLFRAEGARHEFSSRGISHEMDNPDAVFVTSGVSTVAGCLRPYCITMLRMSLSAKTVARRHGVSDRYMHCLFEETGQTFSGFVLEERLKRAFQLLISPAWAGMRIGDIASDTGFGDISTFNRAFPRHFGDTPHAIRRKTYAQ